MFNHKKKPHILSGALHTLFKAFYVPSYLRGHGALSLGILDGNMSLNLNPLFLTTKPHSLGLSVREKGFRLSDGIQSRIPDIAAGERERERDWTLKQFQELRFWGG